MGGKYHRTLSGFDDHAAWGGCQVWTLTQFFLFPFVKKIIDLLGGQINDPYMGQHFSLPFLLATPSSPSPTLEGLFS